MNEMERLQAIMQDEKLSAKDFAAEVGISAATMSNILNEKNKPSLEVMQKVLGRFRLISPEWLILGVGTMYKQKGDAASLPLFDIKPEVPVSDLETTEAAPAINSQPASAASARAKQQIQIIERTIERKVTKVVVFFDDGTFQELSL